MDSKQDRSNGGRLMVRIRMTLRDRTLYTLGDEWGGDLLARGAVHPILGADRKNPGYLRHNEPYWNHGVTGYLGLGLNAGPQSGLTGWDFDRRDLDLPVEANLITARGVHIYTPFMGEKHQQSGFPGLDIRSNGNIVFWADDGSKRVVNRTLAEPQILHSFWRDHVGKEISLQREKRIGSRREPLRGTSTYALSGVTAVRSAYVLEVESRGYRLDLACIARGATLRVQHALEGRRNEVLHRQSLVLVQCGIDPSILAVPAIAAGLPEREVEAVIMKAADDFEATRMSSALDRASAWREAVGPRVRASWHPTLDQLVALAVEQNTISPMVNQSDFHDSVCQTSISRRLSSLDSRGLIHKRGRGRRGMMMLSNCYWLCTKLTARFSDQRCGCDAHSGPAGSEAST